MFKLVNVSINYGRMKNSLRTRIVDAPLDAPFPPVFSWGAISDKKDAFQTHCRIWMKAENFSWDSGWIAKQEQSLRYEGPQLPAGKAITLKIQIQDQEGEKSVPYYQTFYNGAVDWKAGWIGAAKDEAGRTIYFRREFCVTKPIQSAILYACGVGYQKVFLNGQPLDDAVLDPAHTDYSKTCQYVVYPEIYDRLQLGNNCVSAMIGEGWRRNNTIINDDQTSKTTFAGTPAFSAMLCITYIDGQQQWILTDEDWQWGRGAHYDNGIFSGETYNANCTALGWNLPGYVGFSPAKKIEGPGGAMKPMVLNPILEQNTHKPVAVWPVKENTVIIDFGQNIAGVVRLRLPTCLEEGQTIRVMHAEELDEGGTLFTAPLRSAKATDTYIASGDGRDLTVWQPIFTYHGFRYAQIEGLGTGFDPGSIEAVELYTDLNIRSSFRCGDGLVSKIHDMCVATERANQHSILTDCPNRDERQAWMNDATVRFEETPYNFDIGRMFPKLIRDIIDAQNQDGAITCTAPFVLGSQPADPVCSSFLVAAKEAYMHTGNKSIILEGYENFKAWEQCLLNNSDEYIVNYSYYGDWAGPAYACEGEDGAVSAVTPGIFISTGYSYYNCRLLALFATILEKPAEVVYWSDLAEKIKSAMLRKWYDPAEAKMATGSNACQAFTLWLELLPEGEAQRVAKRLRDDLVASAYQFNTGNLCTRYLMDVLSRYGYLEDAWKLITKTTYPSFGYMIQQEATTIWERFEQKKNPGMNSHNHPMYGAIDYWLYAYLCGIRPIEQGFDKIAVAPYIPKDLQSAQATIDTVKGEVAVRWIKRYEQIHLYVSIPFGTRASIIFDGQTYEVGSGFHHFSAPVEA